MLLDFVKMHSRTPVVVGMTVWWETRTCALFGKTQFPSYYVCTCRLPFTYQPHGFALAWFHSSVIKHWLVQAHQDYIPSTVLPNGVAFAKQCLNNAYRRVPPVFNEFCLTGVVLYTRVYNPNPDKQICPQVFAGVHCNENHAKY